MERLEQRNVSHNRIALELRNGANSNVVDRTTATDMRSEQVRL